ncbi:MAG: sulfite exporter TauE/SafE family protein [Coriobacteriia bacterium]|nr:sulfite exporter TauE/SafE family protein [Coriobacteriia bacterium]
MAGAFVAVGIGFVSGVLSGMFGIGGGIITTPAIRFFTDASALVAVGTPLPVILPSAITGAASYARRGLADVRAGVVVGLAGSLTAVAGAWATRLVGGSVVLVGTALLIVWAAADMTIQIYRPPREDADAHNVPNTGGRALKLAAIGVLTGAYSGFFGLGGGFVLVPLLTRWLRYPIKVAIGTSLVAVALLAVPGTITHALLGNIDWAIAAGLTVGVIPGALVGARISAGAADRRLRIGFALLLLTMALWLGASEVGALL